MHNLLSGCFEADACCRGTIPSRCISTFRRTRNACRTYGKLMQLLTELAPYYLRKRQIEFEVKLLLSEIATVTCSILDSSGNDITHDEGVLYSKMNILDVKRAYNSDVCKLYVSFQRAKYFVTVKMTAKDIHQNIVDSKCCSFRVYSDAL